MGGTISDEQLERYIEQRRQRELSDRDARIKQLERQCAVLAAEIDRMRPIVDAAIESARGNNDYKGIARIRRVVKIYEAAKESSNGR